MDSLATDGLLQPEKLLAARPNRQTPHGPVHGAALRAGQDPRAAGPRAVVQPDDLDGDVQRSAQLARHPPALPVLVLPVSDRAAVLDQRRAVAPRPGRAAAGGRSRSTASRRWTRWCWWGTAWADWWQAAGAWKAATTTGSWPAACRSSRSRPSRRCARSCARRFYFHPNPSIRRVVMIATPHHGSQFSNQTTQYLLGKLIHLPADAGQHASRSCSATTTTCCSTIRY